MGAVFRDLYDNVCLYDFEMNSILHLTVPIFHIPVICFFVEVESLSGPHPVLLCFLSPVGIKVVNLSFGIKMRVVLFIANKTI